MTSGRGFAAMPVLTPSLSEQTRPVALLNTNRVCYCTLYTEQPGLCSLRACSPVSTLAIRK